MSRGAGARPISARLGIGRWGALISLLTAALAVAAPGEPSALSAPAAVTHSQRTAVVPQATVAELLAGRSADWRVARLKGRPAILVIEFPDLSAQAMAMNRLAAWVEKSGVTRDRLLNDAALSRLISTRGDTPQTFYLGHDYAANDLARFFELATRQGQALNTNELRLRALLLEVGLLEHRARGFEARGLQALVTFTAQQVGDPLAAAAETVDTRRRESVLLHELSHGIYMTDRAYREFCRRFWRQRLTESERQIWRQFLARQDYDIKNEDLVINETQAYLMHTPDDRAFDASSLGLAPARLEAMRARFRAR
jgi:hypothetical protein